LVLLGGRGWMDSGKERKQVGGFVLRCFAMGLGLGVMRLSVVVVVVVMVGWMLRVVALRPCSCWCLSGLEGWMGPRSQELKLQ
jgi:hypothetical protein